MMRRLIAAVLTSAALVAGAQTPAANYTDLWWNPAESGWGLTITQHASNQIWVVWYTYDPRSQDPSSAGNFKPLWINMPGGHWTSPTSVTGDVFVLNGVPFSQPGSNREQTRVGTFTLSFNNASSGTFTYNISPPPGLAPNDPAYGLPTMTGTKQIERLNF
jgi:hypothetical protein